MKVNTEEVSKAIVERINDLVLSRKQNVIPKMFKQFIFRTNLDSEELINLGKNILPHSIATKVYEQIQEFVLDNQTEIMDDMYKVELVLDKEYNPPRGHIKTTVHLLF